MPLILTRPHNKPATVIEVAGVKIVVERLTRNRISIDAPAEVRIRRGELLDQAKQEAKP